MSKYKRIQTEFKSELLLLKAFNDLDIPVERGQHGLPLFDFLGDRRPETAQYVIRRHNVGGGANDIGFARKLDGNFEIILSEFDSGKGRRGLEIVNQVKQRYAYHSVVDAARKKGYTVQEKRGKGGVIQLQLVSYK